ncbi:MAG TPA: BlaI/MecI/CopY family transcriptional regulator [Candidatus Hydrogenedentes bacterium]|nr:BlaI/MecI/CopY family transcriptional regulator [Candidatus Hydrogenedentota bacterium]HIJ73469.1 BlaI/MecI/CopY family transcriptional regulator [Candidatus Hydrogenedentota bacterium]
MKKLPRISEAEWQVMRVLWAEAPQTANDVVEALDNTDWSPKTVKTLINRLVRKGALGFDKDGRVYHYYPLVQEKDCVRAESRSFLQRVFGGAVTPMVAAIIEDEDLTPEEIAELRRILDEKGRG